MFYIVRHFLTMRTLVVLWCSQELNKPTASIRPRKQWTFVHQIQQHCWSNSYRSITNERAQPTIYKSTIYYSERTYYTAYLSHCSRIRRLLSTRRNRSSFNDQINKGKNLYLSSGKTLSYTSHGLKVCSFKAVGMFNAINESNRSLIYAHCLSHHQGLHKSLI